MLEQYNCLIFKVIKVKVIYLYSANINILLSNDAFTITSLAIIRPEHSRTISGPWGLYTPVLPNNFSRCTQGRNCPKPGTHLRLSEPRPTLGKQLA